MPGDVRATCEWFGLPCSPLRRVAARYGASLSRPTGSPPTPGGHGGTALLASATEWRMPLPHLTALRPSMTPLGVGGPRHGLTGPAARVPSACQSHEASPGATGHERAMREPVSCTTSRHGWSSASLGVPPIEFFI